MDTESPIVIKKLETKTQPKTFTSFVKNIQREQEIVDKLAVEKLNQRDAFTTHWQEKSLSKVLQSDLKRLAESIEQELKNANTEVTLLRRAQLRELYANDLARYESELGAMGLSIYRDRI